MLNCLVYSINGQFIYQKWQAKTNMAEVLDQVTDMITDEEPEGFLHLTYSERIIGFVITGICAILAGILSIVSLFILNLRKFSVLFTLSSILFFVSLSLLVGFSRLFHSCSD